MPDNVIEILNVGNFRNHKYLKNISSNSYIENVIFGKFVGDDKFIMSFSEYTLQYGGLLGTDVP